MTEPLFLDLWGKLDRANNHFGNLVGDIRAYVESGKYRVELERQPDTGDQVVRLRVEEMPPVKRWSIRAGEITYQVRSALDHSIERLTLNHRRTPLDGTQFPIFTYRDSVASGGRIKGFHDRAKKGKNKGIPIQGSGLYMIRGVDPVIGNVVETMQPYHRGNDVPNHPLWMLGKLSNIDKHRALAVVVMVVISGSIELVPAMKQVGPNQWMSTGPISASIEGRVPFEPDAELARASGDAQMNYNAALDVAFGQGGPAADRNILEILADFLRCGVGIIRTFEALTT
jgi:hypothetical protein